MPRHVHHKTFETRTFNTPNSYNTDDSHKPANTARYLKSVKKIKAKKNVDYNMHDRTLKTVLTDVSDWDKSYRYEKNAYGFEPTRQSHCGFCLDGLNAAP